MWISSRKVILKMGGQTNPTFNALPSSFFLSLSSLLSDIEWHSLSLRGRVGIVAIEGRREGCPHFFVGNFFGRWWWTFCTTWYGGEGRAIRISNPPTLWPLQGLGTKASSARLLHSKNCWSFLSALRHFTFIWLPAWHLDILHAFLMRMACSFPERASEGEREKRNEWNLLQGERARRI